MEGIRIARRVGAAASLAHYVDHELNPGDRRQSDEEVLEFCRRTGGTVYHPVGTRKMSRNANAPPVPAPLGVPDACRCPCLLHARGGANRDQERTRHCGWHAISGRHRSSGSISSRPRIVPRRHRLGYGSVPLVPLRSRLCSPIAIGSLLGLGRQGSNHAWTSDSQCRHRAAMDDRLRKRRVQQRLTPHPM